MKKRILRFLAISFATAISISSIEGMSLAENLANGWMPEWKVGDWWIVKESIEVSRIRGKPYPLWGEPHLIRFEVIGIEWVNGKECYAVERRNWPIDKFRPEQRTIFYFRKANLQLVRKTKYSYLFGKLQAPRSIDYTYTQDVAYKPCGGLINMPVFPLVYQGARADRLAKPRMSPLGGHVTQIVSQRSAEDFRPKLANVELKVSPGLLCYDVVLETGGDKEVKDKWEVRFVDQLWSPSFPWYLYEEVGHTTSEGIKELGRRTWLVDCSSFHK